MELDFLHQFKKRMKHVGMYSLLFRNSMQKQTWKNYHINTVDEQVNLLFSVLLFIMEQSLTERPCTIDLVAEFLEQINLQYFKRDLTYEMQLELADYIVNGILCNEGNEMNFEAFDYDESKNAWLPIRFLSNQVIYIDGQVRRTTYQLTEDGYNLLLSTLEMESSMQITIHEMIFQMQLERASYDQAADEIKRVFNGLRIQLQSIEDAMRRIRQNALAYTIDQYEALVIENMQIIDTTKDKFEQYRVHVAKLVKELEDYEIETDELDQEQKDNLNYLKIIEGYINRAMDEYQRIFTTHFDMKALYDRELESMMQMSLIKRFSLRNELYNPVLKDVSKLEHLDVFLRPLFSNQPDSIYNLQKAIQYQGMKTKEIEEEEMVDFFDEEAYEKEMEEKRSERIRRYDICLAEILLCALRASEDNQIELKALQDILSENRDSVFPSIEIFRDVMIELIRARDIDVIALRRDREEHFYETPKTFRLQHSFT